MIQYLNITDSTLSFNSIFFSPTQDTVQNHMLYLTVMSFWDSKRFLCFNTMFKGYNPFSYYKILTLLPMLNNMSSQPTLHPVVCTPTSPQPLCCPPSLSPLVATSAINPGFLKVLQVIKIQLRGESHRFMYVLFTLLDLSSSRQTELNT